jgi:hypothetical protein
MSCQCSWVYEDGDVEFPAMSLARYVASPENCGAKGVVQLLKGFQLDVRYEPPSTRLLTHEQDATRSSVYL